MHGKNPAEKSDGTLNEIKAAIDKEAQGKTKGRGLNVNDQTNLQTFEIFIPVDVREQYNYVSFKNSI